MRRFSLQVVVPIVLAGCHPAPGAAPAPAPAAAAAPGDLYRLDTYTDAFREDQARPAPIGVPRPTPYTVASVDLGLLNAGDVLLVTSAYTVESRIDGTNIGIATTICLADQPGGYREGDREILGFGTANLTNHGDVYPHYATPSFSGVYRVAPGDERFRYVNLITWIGTDDTRQQGKEVSLRRAQLDVLRFARAAASAHAAR